VREYRERMAANVPSAAAASWSGCGSAGSAARDLDIQAATAAITMPHHNGRTEGVSIKTKMIKRQRYGRAGFILPRHRILLG
jgi:transposase